MKVIQFQHIPATDHHESVQTAVMENGTVLIRYYHATKACWGPWIKVKAPTDDDLNNAEEE